ncbi:MAG: alpha/beta fold hydrolase, partial [Chloroflexi bacterium]
EEQAPVFYLAGGPGESGLYDYPFWLYHPLRQQHDIVLVDLRGTGISSPQLICITWQTDVCYETLSETVDLSAFSTASLAADIPIIIEALGYEQVHLYSISYGAQVALSVMEQAPHLVKSAIFDAPLPPSINPNAHIAANFMRALQTLINDCQADILCSNLYPDMQQVLDSTYQQVGSAPLLYDIYTLNDLDLLIHLHNFLRQGLVEYIPAIIYEIQNGQTSTLEHVLSSPPAAWPDEIYAEAIANYLNRQGNTEEILALWESLPLSNRITMTQDMFYGELNEFSQGLYNTIMCREIVPLNTPDIAISSVFSPELTRAITTIFKWDDMICQLWPVEHELSRLDYIRPTTPVLVLYGRYDPTLSPSWIEAFAQSLPQSTLIQHNGGHGVRLEQRCIWENIIIPFLNSPESAQTQTCEQSLHWYVSPN